MTLPCRCCHPEAESAGCCKQPLAWRAEATWDCQQELAIIWGVSGSRAGCQPIVVLAFCCHRGRSPLAGHVGGILVTMQAAKKQKVFLPLPLLACIALHTTCASTAVQMCCMAAATCPSEAQSHSHGFPNISFVGQVMWGSQSHRVC